MLERQRATKYTNSSRRKKEKVLADQLRERDMFIWYFQKQANLLTKTMSKGAWNAECCKCGVLPQFENVKLLKFNRHRRCSTPTTERWHNLSAKLTSLKWMLTRKESPIFQLRSLHNNSWNFYCLRNTNIQCKERKLNMQNTTFVLLCPWKTIANRS